MSEYESPEQRQIRELRVGVPDRESGLEITERIHRGTTY